MEEPSKKQQDKWDYQPEVVNREHLPYPPEEKKKPTIQAKLRGVGAALVGGILDLIWQCYY